ncbi:hypothetical protein [Pontivivens ytuae]|uniref:Uncharacterized protein n=1 Tax=Pontivivens ytuae TaxID=2789856 RepID=A0A7S9LTV2_9RHOB|nr:hypothetical protein [Pontivivens ytuae]QPH55217.1 hypothetical protein I0K15_05610 [Pontivivens ytuae]
MTSATAPVERSRAERAKPWVRGGSARPMNVPVERSSRERAEPRTSLALARAAVLATCFAAPAVAEPYSFTVPAFSAMDEACLAELNAKLDQSYPTVEGFTNDAPGFVDVDASSVTLATYAGIAFSFDDGGVTRGTVTCIFDTKSITLTQVDVVLEDPGFPTAADHRMADVFARMSPGSVRNTGFSWTVNNDR